MTNNIYAQFSNTYYAIYNRNQLNNQYKRIASGNMLL